MPHCKSIEWASAQVPPTPLIGGGVLQKRLERLEGLERLELGGLLERLEGLRLGKRQP